MDTEVVFYHVNCTDGFGAAFAAYLSLGEKNTQYIGIPPNADLDDVLHYAKGKHVLMFDVSLSRSNMLKLYNECKSLTLYDHHASAEKDLADLPFCYFDMTKSGAMLAWNFFHPDQRDKNAYRLFQYIQDRDLWQFALPYSEAFSAWFQNEPHDFAVYMEYLRDDVFEEAIEKGKVILINQAKQVEKLCHYSRHVVKEGKSLLVVNSCMYQSELGNNLCKRFPDIDAAVVYYQNSSGVYLGSVRSTKGNAVEVARLFSEKDAGGHPNAAGFKCSHYPFD